VWRTRTMIASTGRASKLANSQSIANSFRSFRKLSELSPSCCLRLWKRNRATRLFYAGWRISQTCQGLCQELLFPLRSTAGFCGSLILLGLTTCLSILFFPSCRFCSAGWRRQFISPRNRLNSPWGSWAFQFKTGCSNENQVAIL
jgi:hypothetical protein